MLAVHCKKAEPLELKGPVQDYIAATYGDSAAQDAAEDLETIQGQRAQIVGAGGSLPTLRDLMAKCDAASKAPTPPAGRTYPDTPAFLGTASLMHQSTSEAAAPPRKVHAVVCCGGLVCLRLALVTRFMHGAS